MFGFVFFVAAVFVAAFAAYLVLWGTSECGEVDRRSHVLELQVWLAAVGAALAAVPLSLAKWARHRGFAHRGWHVLAGLVVAATVAVVVTRHEVDSFCLL